MENKYWIWLQAALGEGAKTDKIFSLFSTAEEIYRTSDESRRKSEVFTEKQLFEMNETPLSSSEDVITLCETKGWKILTPESDSYPEKLRLIKNFPLALYCVGELPKSRETLFLAMVGARKATAYGLDIAGKLSYSLAKAGAVVVSGGALGIDAESHRAALKAGGKTVAVLGHGFGVRYLMENRPLWIEASKHGAVLTEFRPGYPVRKFNFPMRNRIISGMSNGTIVVEAAKKSGSLITAKCASEQGRDVFAIPGNINNAALEGGNNLIHDGAKPVFKANDILEEYIDRYPDIRLLSADEDLMYYTPAVSQTEQTAPKKKSGNKSKSSVFVKMQAPDTLSPEEARVYGFIGENPVSVDEIIEKTKIENRKVLIALTMLEMQGLVKCREGRRYVAVSQNP